MRPSTLWLSLALLCTQAGCNSCGHDKPSVNADSSAAPVQHTGTPEINTSQPGAAAVVMPSPTPGGRIMAIPMHQASPARPTNRAVMPPPPAATPEVDTDKPGAAAHVAPPPIKRTAPSIQVAGVPKAPAPSANTPADIQGSVPVKAPPTAFPAAMPAEKRRP